jgi:hypothetical protein
MDPELALAKLGVKLMFSQTWKHNLEMFFLFFHTL